MVENERLAVIEERAENLRRHGSIRLLLQSVAEYQNNAASEYH